MANKIDVLPTLFRCAPCRCMSVAQLGERDDGCDRCLAISAVAELIGAAQGIIPAGPIEATDRFEAALARVKGN